MDVPSYLYPHLANVLEQARPYIDQEIERRKNAHREVDTDIVAWAERAFYIPGTAQPIVLAEHQKAILRLCFTRDDNGKFPYRTIIYSTIKKSGKSTIAGLILRWYAETQGRFADLYAVGNDKEQAKGRSFLEAKRSVELTPGYDTQRDRLPGVWDNLKETLNCRRTGSVIRALAVDAKGEAGGHPAISVWTELWGFQYEDALRFWDELTPVPTIPDSLRLVETYAGFLQESQLLHSLYMTGLEGRQLTAGEVAERTNTALGAFAEAPAPKDLVPLWENRSNSQLTYWDTGVAARRMPWQLGEDGQAYYREQEGSLPAPAFRRLHFNEWTSSETNFIPDAAWNGCYDATLPALLPGDKVPLVIGVDAATTGDCFAIVVVSRHPKRHDEVAVRRVKVWDPKEQGAPVDYDEAERFLRLICEGGHVEDTGYGILSHPKSMPVEDCRRCLANDHNLERFNVIQVAYDPYQLDQMMQRLRKDEVVWCEPFPQQGDRLKADRALYDSVLRRTIAHDGNERLKEHMLNAGARVQKDQDSTLRLVKITPNRKIDAAVALSMAAARCLYFTL